jgi:DNA-binding NtrC family response regulator
MPKMNGFKLLKSIKSFDPKFPVVLITGFNITKEDINNLSDKPDYFVKKPFALEYIKIVVEELLSNTK